MHLRCPLKFQILATWVPVLGILESNLIMRALIKSNFNLNLIQNLNSLLRRDGTVREDGNAPLQVHLHSGSFMPFFSVSLLL